MYTLIVILHLTVSIFLIFIILIQSSKGAEIGAAFGGSTQTLFGSRGAATFMNKLTTVAAIVFMLTSFSLAVFSMKEESIISDKKIPAKSSPARPSPDTTSGPLQEQAPKSEEIPAGQQPLQPAK